MTPATKEAPKNGGTMAAQQGITMSAKMAAAKGVVDVVAKKVHAYIANGELNLPKDYSVDNALKTAWLVLQGVKDRNKNPALEVCTQASIANALLEMIVQGLNPIKKQCAFVVFGDTLGCLREYFGSITIAERTNKAIADWGHGVVYADDEFEYEINHGKKMVSLHRQNIKNVNPDKIVAAYAMALDSNGDPLLTEIMTIDQIHQSWKQSPNKPFDDQGRLKPDSAHGKFPADMSVKTLYNKVCKIMINKSSDSSLLLKEIINRNAEIIDEVIVAEQIENQANTGTVLRIEETATGVIDVTPKKPDEVEITDPTEEQMQKQADEAAKGLKETSNRKPGF